MNVILAAAATIYVIVLTIWLIIDLYNERNKQ